MSCDAVVLLLLLWYLLLRLPAASADIAASFELLLPQIYVVVAVLISGEIGIYISSRCLKDTISPFTP